MALLTQKTLQQWKESQFQIQNGKCCLCGLPLESWNQSAGDHNHHTGNMRGLLHPLCNSVLEGKVAGLMYRAGLKGKTDFPTVLRNLADYWEQDYSNNPVHPNYVNDTAKKFAKLPSRQKMIQSLHDDGVEYVDRTYTRDQLIDVFKKEFKKSLA